MKNLIILILILWAGYAIVDSLAHTVITTSAHIVAYNASQAEAIDRL